MATLHSAIDWTGREVDGVILGEPAISEDGLAYIWDHPSLPADWIDENGDIWVEVPTEEIDDAQNPA